MCDTFGGETIWHSEIDPAACKVLDARSDVPNVGDLTDVDWSAVERPDVLCAGFPCQGLSVAGHRAGLRAGSKSALWWQIVDRVLGPMRPNVLVLENVPAIVNGRDAQEDDDGSGDLDGDGMGGTTADAGWLGAVLGSLAELGYVGRYGVVRAADAGAPHLRARWFCVAAQPSAVIPRPVGQLTPAAHLTGWLLPTPTAMQPGGNVEMFLARKTRNGMPPHVTDLRMMLDIIEREHDGWGPYEKAVARWGCTIGRDAPPISQRPRVSEWMMGWPDGWCTDVEGVTDAQALRMCGNGVVPQQAELALRLLCG